ncbi:MAG: NUDIX domain-containing protein [Nanoarchaeota archaeon]|nr:NUDIX domain-containing protein [Nanoarchaeota archaeon]
MKTDLVVAGYIVHDNKVLLIHHKKLNMWLPPGGHIDKDETPDDAVIREIKEELNLDIDFMYKSDIPAEGDVKKVLVNPFHVNVHNAGDHDHCCFFYLCKPKNIESLAIVKSEVNDYQWFSSEELNQVSAGVRNSGQRALELYSSLSE